MGVSPIVIVHKHAHAASILKHPMPLIELPHTAGCFVCGRDNPHGLRLASLVNTDTGQVQTVFTPAAHHIGFDGIIHGGILATLLDELMVWTAIWATGKACVAGELSLRFSNKATPGMPLRATAKITRNRSRIIETAAEVREGTTLICTGVGKYVPLGRDETVAFLTTLIPEPSTIEAIERLKLAAP
jgi:uncharacterized protein (TIGR00369 family)